MAAACLIALLCASHASAASPVYVFPIPGSKVAPPGAQIVFRGVSVNHIGSITVTGSRSGRHSGRLRGDSDGNGGSFLPSSGFTPGETVTVSTHLNIEGSGKGKWSFRVANPGPVLPNVRWSPAPRTSGDTWFFHSRHDLQPAAVHVNTNGQTAPGDIFVGPQNGPLQDGPEILDNNGNLIFFKDLPGNDSPSDVRVQKLYGQPVLTWWQGYVSDGVGVGEDVINDTSYRVTHVIQAADGLHADLHEFEITPHNTALLTIEYPVHWDDSSVGGSRNGMAFDSVVQEIDIKTGLLLFQWDSLDHVRLSDSYQTIKNSPLFDFFHVNSVEPMSDGTLLISSRNTWSAYKVDHNTGRVIWVLGGKRSSFKMLGGSAFAFQHDVRVHAPNDSTVTVFDDENGAFQAGRQARALTLSINTATMTATKVTEYDHSPPLLPRAEGNYQLLGNGDGFVGWGLAPYFSEYTPAGTLVYDARFVDSNSSYTAWRFQWTGTPHTLPAIAASTSGSTTFAFVSWNGATNVASWQLLGGSSSSHLHKIGSRVAKTSFETRFAVPAEQFVAVQALDSNGHVMATSSTIHPK